MDNIFPQPIACSIWDQKYRFKTNRQDYSSDVTVDDTMNRVAKACAKVLRYQNNPPNEVSYETKFYNALDDFKFLPAGRILSGAGTGRNVTLFNCYVMGTIPDSLDGIFNHLKEAALTMQQGGGIGYDFSTLRPKGSLVKGVESDASGPLTFMDVWNAMCKTIMSAGNRRGAMMATMRCDHPDIEEFIVAKRDPLRLRHFNLSVLCTDKFMEAVDHDSDWDLVFEGKTYKTIKAKYLWDLIMENTYKYAEPGVIFIDRINNDNNLYFMETINATNPCGEQPLPPYGACLLGSINLTKFIMNPFTNIAYVDYSLLMTTVSTAVEMLDAIIDISKFPLKEQQIEARTKRRMGLGITGLADAMFLLGLRYGSKESVEFTEHIMEQIAIYAYEKSIELAEKFGPAPFCQYKKDREAFVNSKMIKQMPDRIKKGILEHGIRNSHLLSIAPTGTISMYAGNVSSGVEPIFATSYIRKITNMDGTKREEEIQDYAVWLYNECGHKAGDAWWDSYMVTAQDLSPEDHIVIQAAAQEWVDSSISKTINCPEDISFEDFKQIYISAFEKGCKGCTTYRPNDVTGSVIEIKKDKEPEKEEQITEPFTFKVSDDLRIMPRPEEVPGITYKLKWANTAYYVTFNHVTADGQTIPFEIFVNSKNPEHQAWISALTRMVSAVFQRGGDILFVAEELQSVFDAKGGEWIKGRYVPSLVALIGLTLEEYLSEIGYMSESEDKEIIKTYTEQSPVTGKIPEQCPNCLGFNMVFTSGCMQCMDCGHSKCG